MSESKTDIKVTVRGKVPRIPFEDMARAVLGPKYTLSVVVCGDRLAQRMNKEYRNKTYYPNVLSFPLAKYDGEIFLNIRKAEREARSMEISTVKRAALLYVHGLFHLKGMDHSDKMEREEQNILRRFKLN
ncbi:MAG: rRNA maturation RNase YbeY [Candidatus Pacebacteria bacterium]|nr:rRNA maturation RNase YbeY [Candidatus Paceibacterota bacterium]